MHGHVLQSIFQQDPDLVHDLMCPLQEARLIHQLDRGLVMDPCRLLLDLDLMIVSRHVHRLLPLLPCRHKASPAITRSMSNPVRPKLAIASGGGATAGSPKRVRLNESHASSSIQPPPGLSMPEPSTVEPVADPQVDSSADLSSDYDDEDSFYTTVYLASDGQPVPVIVKPFNELLKDDILKHWEDVQAAMLKELKSFVDLDAICIAQKGASGNCMTSRWLHKFKMIDGKKQVRSRLTVHGFKDADAESLTTYAATATKWSQRLILATAAQRRWEICSADVSSAFIRGLTFQELIKRAIRHSSQSCCILTAEGK